MADFKAADGDGPLVWVTRAEPGAASTARRVADLGYQPLISPLLEMESIAAVVELSGVGCLAFTSANAVRAFAAVSDVRELHVFTVGDRTAEEAYMAGFRRVWSADGDVEALAGLVKRQHPPGVVLHPCTAEPAGDLVGELTRSDVEARRLILYRAVDAEPVAALGAWERLSAVLIHSPRAARTLARLMAARAAPKMHAICISYEASRPLEHLDLASVVAAELPKEASLLNLLEKTLTP